MNSKLLSDVLNKTVKSFEDGHWVTTEEGNHVLIGSDGEPKAGNPHVIEKMKVEEKPKGEKETPKDSQKNSTAKQPKKGGLSSKKAAQNVAAGKDPELKHACQDWVVRSGTGQGIGFQKLNSNPNSPAAQRVRSQFEKLDTYQSDKPLYRSMSFKSVEDRNAFLSKIKEGDTFPVRGMAMSTTKDQKFAQNFVPSNMANSGNFSNCRTHIEIVSSKSGRDLSPLLDGTGLQHQKQSEVVFLSGTNFRVKSIQRVDSKDSLDIGRKDSDKGKGKFFPKWDEATKIILEEV